MGLSPVLECGSNAVLIRDLLLGCKAVIYLDLTGNNQLSLLHLQVRVLCLYAFQIVTLA